MGGARTFVTIAFLILGASFFASTGLLIYEFRGLDWFTLIAAHSYLFFFFPVLGLLALFAFYLPSVVFTDLYWNHLPHGKLRFLLGVTVVLVAAYGLTRYLDKPPRSIWEASPSALLADKGGPAGRQPILDVLADMRQKAQARIGLSEFARPCNPDPLLEMPEDMAKKRYCFPAKAHMTGPECCRVQDQFAATMLRLQENPATRSMSATYDTLVFLPLKVFFVLIVVAIGIALTLWRNRIDQQYGQLVPKIERGVIIGALAMLFWPAMDYGYQQTANALFGRLGSGPQLRLSLVIAPWVLLLLFYFLRRLGKQGEMVGQISGVVVAAVAVLRYEQLNDWVGHLFGIGAAPAILVGLAAFAVVGLIAHFVLEGVERFTRPRASTG